MAPATPTYAPRDPSRTVLYKVVAEHLETFLASLDTDPDAKGLPAYVQREFYDYLQCGILTHGFLRLGCDTCKKEMLLACSCKRRGFCPSCAGRRMAQTAAHLIERVIPWVQTRQWVVAVPMPLRDWMASSQALTAQVQTIIRTTIRQYYVTQAVTRGIDRQQAHPGSVTFIQRFGSAINLNMHFHRLFLVPLPRVHLVRYGGCLAPHCQLRGALIPTPRQQGVDGGDAHTGSSPWNWARLLKRMFALAIAHCPLCQRGSLRIIAAITQEAVHTRLLRHLKRAAVPPPIAPARLRQATFDWVA